MQEKYVKQVALVIETIPHVQNEKCFALKGGTAINLFYRDMPRLSVDIDVTYLPIEDRKISYSNINNSLNRILHSLIKANIHATIQGQGDEKKIIATKDGVSIKIEPNYTIRGTVFNPTVLSICKKAEIEFGYVEMQVISYPELYGGKMCAALDRQHPRDLFDIKYLLDSKDKKENLILGFIAMLLSHNRPVNELLNPIIKDQQEVFEKEFKGMTNEAFSYDDHISTMHNLLDFVHSGLLEYKTFLLDFFEIKETVAPFSNLYKLPAILWKQKNLEYLKKTNPQKFTEQVIELEKIFDKK